MTTKILQRNRDYSWLAMAAFVCLANMASAANNAPPSANSTPPQNPFGPKPDASATPPASVAPVPSGGDFVTTLRAMLLRRFDKNNEGKLDAAELAEARKIFSGGQDTRVPTPAQATLAANGPLFGLRPLIMSRYDHRGEGRLDAAELDEISSLLFGPANTPSNSADDLAALQREILRHFDKKGDGQLDATERAAAKAWLEQVIADLDKSTVDKSPAEMK